MAFFAVIYEYVVPETELDAVRPEHRTYLRGLSELVLSGPWVGGSSGALLVFEADDLAHAEELVAGDPIVRAGCVGSREIREWNPVNGRLATSLS
jgi:uncharacterized protein YciI